MLGANHNALPPVRGSPSFSTPSLTQPLFSSILHTLLIAQQELSAVTATSSKQAFARSAPHIRSLTSLSLSLAQALVSFQSSSITPAPLPLPRHSAPRPSDKRPQFTIREIPHSRHPHKNRGAITTPLSSPSPSPSPARAPAPAPAPSQSPSLTQRVVQPSPPSPSSPQPASTPPSSQPPLPPCATPPLPPNATSRPLLSPRPPSPECADEKLQHFAPAPLASVSAPIITAPIIATLVIVPPVIVSPITSSQSSPAPTVPQRIPQPSSSPESTPSPTMTRPNLISLDDPTQANFRSEVRRFFKLKIKDDTVVDDTCLSEHDLCPVCVANGELRPSADTAWHSLRCCRRYAFMRKPLLHQLGNDFTLDFILRPVCKDTTNEADRTRLKSLVPLTYEFLQGIFGIREYYNAP